MGSEGGHQKKRSQTTDSAKVLFIILRFILMGRERGINTYTRGFTVTKSQTGHNGGSIVRLDDRC